MPATVFEGAQCGISSRLVSSSLFHHMNPGLTEYWQIQGRQKVSYAQRVEMDLFHVKNWLLLLDLKILVKTPIRVLRGEGPH